MSTKTMEGGAAAPPPASTSVARKLDPRLVVGGALVLSGLGTAGWYIAHADRETTDNAQVQCDVVGIPARVAGVVERIHFEDNQLVPAGFVLAELDPASQRARLAQAEAELASARMAVLAAAAETELAVANARGDRELTDASVDVASATHASTRREIEQAAAMVRAAVVTHRRAVDALARERRLLADGATSQEAVDTAQDRLDTAEAELERRAAEQRQRGLDVDLAVVAPYTPAEVGAHAEVGRVDHELELRPGGAAYRGHQLDQALHQALASPGRPRILGTGPRVEVHAAHPRPLELLEQTLDRLDRVHGVALELVAEQQPRRAVEPIDVERLAQPGPVDLDLWSVREATERRGRDALADGGGLWANDAVEVHRRGAPVCSAMHGCSKGDHGLAARHLGAAGVSHGSSRDQPRVLATSSMGEPARATTTGWPVCSRNATSVGSSP